MDPRVVHEGRRVGLVNDKLHVIGPDGKILERFFCPGTRIDVSYALSLRVFRIMCMAAGDGHKTTSNGAVDSVFLYFLG